MTEEKFINLILSHRLNYDKLFAIVVDEAYERSISTDVIVGILKQHIIKNHDLKIVITSATLDPKKFSDYYWNCPKIEIPGKKFPVDVVYAPLDDHVDTFDAVIGKALEIHDNQNVSSGDILCFLA
jgi:ATP-dependent RNA helicase DHX8/PRP22